MEQSALKALFAGFVIVIGNGAILSFIFGRVLLFKKQISAPSATLLSLLCLLKFFWTLGLLYLMLVVAEAPAEWIVVGAVFGVLFFCAGLGGALHFLRRQQGGTKASS